MEEWSDSSGHYISTFPSNGEDLWIKGGSLRKEYCRVCPSANYVIFEQCACRDSTVAKSTSCSPGFVMVGNLTSSRFQGCYLVILITPPDDLRILPESCSLLTSRLSGSFASSRSSLGEAVLVCASCTAASHCHAAQQSFLPWKSYAH
jgi:hypothetical protein